MRTAFFVPALATLFLHAGCGVDDAPAPSEDAPGPAREVLQERSDGPERVGTIDAELAGEPLSRNVLRMDTDDGPRSTGHYSTRTIGGRTLHMLKLGGHAGERLTTRELISVGINVMEAIGPCPCTFEDQSVEYWVSPSEVYQDRGATITLEEFSTTSDGWYQAKGSFSAILELGEPTEGPRFSRAVPIHGTFDIDAIYHSR